MIKDFNYSIMKLLLAAITIYIFFQVNHIIIFNYIIAMNYHYFN